MDRPYEDGSGKLFTYQLHHPLYKELSDSSAWPAPLFALGRAQMGTPDFELSHTPQGDPIKGTTAQVRDQHLILSGSDANSFLAFIKPQLDYIRLRGQIFRVVGVEIANNRLFFDTTPPQGSVHSWEAGIPMGNFDVIQPVHSDFDTTLDDPKTHGLVAVSAKDQHGNESKLSTAVPVFKIYRIPPDPPVMPEFEELRLYASVPDYHHRSVFHLPYQLTSAALAMHVFRASEDTLFQQERRIRSSRMLLNPSRPDHRAYFEDININRRQQIANR